MKIYIAGIYTSNFEKYSTSYEKLDDREKWAHDRIPYHLESYHYIESAKYVDRVRRGGHKLFVDSGAFSAFTKGVTIDLPAYCRWIQEHDDIITYDDGLLIASVLDGIGDPLQTWRNQLHMEELGVTPLPCFHYGEDERFLEWYLERYPYITIGGLVPISKPQQILWLDRIWNDYLVDGSGRAKIKVHGFGLTTLDVMNRYPWYSVDSSSWVQLGAHGNILYKNKILACSSRSPNAKNAWQHVDTLPELLSYDIIQQIMASGYNIERLREIGYSRWIYNAEQYYELGASMRPWYEKRFDRVQPELFDSN